MKTGGWMWAALAVAVGISMYLVKYKVQDLEDKLTAKQTQIERDSSTVRVLEAEWTYLNDPGRLRRLSAQYLEFGPPISQNVVDIDALPMRGTPRDEIAPTPAGEKSPHGVPPLPAGPSIRAMNAPQMTDPFTPPPRTFAVLSERLRHLIFPDAIGAQPKESAR
jgi:hypothetical protein